RIEGLLYPDGGGITINHPAGKTAADYLELLDFDTRVLGIEIWNERGKFGFGPLRDGETLLYYRHWNDIRHGPAPCRPDRCPIRQIQLP
ncbi:MAG TPA: hypothetical protein PLA18_14975, partial [Deltaproteobacteria bacterium]|nr:hypothetical protein [Deltaproteobacteria bacterium]